MIRPLPGLFVAPRANQRASRGGGGVKAGGGWCEPLSSPSGSRQPRLCLPEERGAGRGHRATPSRQRTRPARQTPGPSRLLHWAARATRGGESALGSFPALLNNGAPAPHPDSGGDWAGTPTMGEGGSSEDVELSIACAARERLTSALRGPPCRSHFRDGETEAHAEGPAEPRPRPGPDTCRGPRRRARRDPGSRDPPAAEGASFPCSGDRLTCTLCPDPAPHPLPAEQQARMGFEPQRPVSC